MSDGGYGDDDYVNGDRAYDEPEFDHYEPPEEPEFDDYEPAEEPEFDDYEPAEEPEFDDYEPAEEPESDDYEPMEEPELDDNEPDGEPDYDYDNLDDDSRVVPTALPPQPPKIPIAPPTAPPHPVTLPRPPPTLEPPPLPIPAPPPPPSGTLDPMRPDARCTICLQALANTLFMPCAHLIACAACCDTLGIKKRREKGRGRVRCPVCRIPVMDRILVLRVSRARPGRFSSSGTMTVH